MQGDRCFPSAFATKPELLPIRRAVFVLRLAS